MEWDNNEVEESTINQDQIPKNWYVVEVDEAEEGENSKGTGRAVVLWLKIMVGEYKGRKVRYGLNYEHNNPKAQEIGRSQFKLVRMACGLEPFQNMEREVVKFEGRILEALIAPQKGDSTYSEVKAVRERERKAPAQQTVPAPQSKPAVDTFDDDLPF